MAPQMVLYPNLSLLKMFYSFYQVCFDLLYLETFSVNLDWDIIPFEQNCSLKYPQ